MCILLNGKKIMLFISGKWVSNSCPIFSQQFCGYISFPHKQTHSQILNHLLAA